MNFDHDILFELLPERDKKSFMVWDNIFQSFNGGYIVGVYRAPFEERIVIRLSDYEQRVKQKERDNKLNNLVC